ECRSQREYDSQSEFQAGKTHGSGDSGRMDRLEVMAWVARYEQAWRAAGVDAVEALFTSGARYRPGPYEESMVGHDAIKAFWVDEEPIFTVTAAPVAVDGVDAVVRVEVRYGDPVHQEYRDLW